MEEPSEGVYFISIEELEKRREIYFEYSEEGGIGDAYLKFYEMCLRCRKKDISFKDPVVLEVNDLFLRASTFPFLATDRFEIIRRATSKLSKLLEEK